jgi:hypothetical protein
MAPTDGSVYIVVDRMGCTPPGPEHPDFTGAPNAFFLSPRPTVA